jgi:hypothetical protein
MDRLRKSLDVGANAGILVLCVLLGVNMVTHRSFDVFGIFGARTTDSLRGIDLPPLAGYNWAAYPETLVLAIRAGCHFCEDSMPFYQRLGELEAAHQLRAHILVVTPDDTEKAKGMPHWSEINVSSYVFNEPLNRIQVSGTPTVMLVDARGRVKRSWVGEQSPKGESEIINAASTRDNTNGWLNVWHLASKSRM